MDTRACNGISLLVPDSPQRALSSWNIRDMFLDMVRIHSLPDIVAAGMRLLIVGLKSESLLC